MLVAAVLAYRFLPARARDQVATVEVSVVPVAGR
jgi:hypothetical protein